MTELLDRFWSGALRDAWLVPVLVLTLALYGLVAAARQAFRLTKRFRRSQDLSALQIMALIHNQEHQIEWLIRAVAAMFQEAALVTVEPDLLLIDLNSRDETPFILQRLIRQYEYMRLITLRRDEGALSGDTVLSLCRSPIAILLDLRGKVEAQRILHELSFVLTKKGKSDIVAKSSQ